MEAIEKKIEITVSRRVATCTSGVYVGSNTLHYVNFTFDDEWAESDAKTMIVLYGDKKQEVVFTGHVAEFPRVDGYTFYGVGVYAGDLRTSTAAIVKGELSALAGQPEHDDPPEDVYTQLLQLASETAEVAQAAEEKAQSVVDAAERGDFDGDPGPAGPQGPQGIQGPQGNPTTVNGKTGASITLTKSDIGLGSVDNVQQYSASNPPPYPVSSVNGKTGVVDLTAEDVGAAVPSGDYRDDEGIFQYATNFIGKHDAAQNAYNMTFRPTASNFSGQNWVRDSIDRATAEIGKIKGKTLVWNQRARSDTASWHSFGNSTVTYSKQDRTHTILATAKNATAASYMGSAVPAALIDDHVYFYSFKAWCPDNNGGVIFYGWVHGSNVVPKEESLFCGIVAKSIQTGSKFVGVKDTRDSDWSNIYVKDFFSIDLTKMFGGNEPQTVEEFRAMFPLDYYAYNTGELVNLNATGLKTVGFNQLDADGHIAVLPGLTYHIEGSYTSLKDSSGNDVTVTDGDFTAAKQDVYTMDGGSCVHQKWAGLRDGETEPYQAHTLSLPISTYFPDGMKSAGTAHDWLTKDKYCHVIGKVDMGTLNWSRQPWGSATRFAVNLGNGEAPILTSKQLANIRCALYDSVVADDIYKNRGDKKFSMHGDNCSISVIDSTYSTASAFKTAMSGVMLYYELANPVETPIVPPLDLTYSCDDYGTEQILPENDDEPVTAPMDAEIYYGIDYEAQVRNSDSLSISKRSMDAFIAAFNSSGLGTITQTWDEANRRYDYTVTAPAEPEV